MKITLRSSLSSVQSRCSPRLWNAMRNPCNQAIFSGKTVGALRSFAADKGLSRLWGFGTKTVIEAYALFKSIGCEIKRPGGRDEEIVNPLRAYIKLKIR